MIDLGEALERPEPTLAVIIDRDMSDWELSQTSHLADVREFRADIFLAQSAVNMAASSEDPEAEPEEPIDLVAIAQRLGNMPLILTIREEGEGGFWTGKPDEKVGLITEVLPNVQAVDIELAAPEAPAVIDMVKRAGRLAIASSHEDVGDSPTERDLEVKLAKSKELGADYAKIVVPAREYEDVDVLASFVLKHRDDGVIILGVGKMGAATRMLLPLIGSRMTYSHLDEETGKRKEGWLPGQMDYIAANILLSRLDPSHRKVNKTPSH